MRMWWVISKPDCPWCDKAIDYIQSKGESCQVYLFDEHPMIVKLMKKANLNTVPQIWCGTEYVGGYEGLTEWLKKTT